MHQPGRGSQGLRSSHIPGHFGEPAPVRSSFGYSFQPNGSEQQRSDDPCSHLKTSAADSLAEHRKRTPCIPDARRSKKVAAYPASSGCDAVGQVARGRSAEANPSSAKVSPIELVAPWSRCRRSSRKSRPALGASSIPTPAPTTIPTPKIASRDRTVSPVLRLVSRPIFLSNSSLSKSFKFFRFISFLLYPRLMLVLP